MVQIIEEIQTYTQGRVPHNHTKEALSVYGIHHMHAIKGTK
jgi:hypothetical protein